MKLVVFERQKPFGIYWDNADTPQKSEFRFEKAGEKKAGEYHIEGIEESWMVSKSLSEMYF